MKKVESIHSRKFLGNYHHASCSERVRGQWLGFAAITLLVVVPQIICIAYGLIPIEVFAGCTAAGVALGWIMYRHLPYRVISCVESRGVPRAPTRERASEDRAA